MSSAAVLPQSLLLARLRLEAVRQGCLPSISTKAAQQIKKAAQLFLFSCCAFVEFLLCFFKKDSRKIEIIAGERGRFQLRACARAASPGERGNVLANLGEGRNLRLYDVLCG